MTAIPVSELRANLMRILKRVEKGSSITITSRGRVVAKLVPPEDSLKIAEEKLAQIRKTAKIHDVIAPISEQWKAEN